MALRTISKSIDLNSSSNKYITDINNNGIQIHSPNYDASQYTENITMNPQGIQLNYGNLPAMELTKNSLVFNEVDTTNNTSTRTAKFGEDTQIGRNGKYRTTINERGIKLITDTNIPALEVGPGSTDTKITTLIDFSDTKHEFISSDSISGGTVYDISTQLTSVENGNLFSISFYRRWKAASPNDYGLTSNHYGYGSNTFEFTKGTSETKQYIANFTSYGASICEIMVYDASNNSITVWFPTNEVVDDNSYIMNYWYLYDFKGIVETTVPKLNIHSEMSAYLESEDGYTTSLNLDQSGFSVKTLKDSEALSVSSTGVTGTTWSKLSSCYNTKYGLTKSNLAKYNPSSYGPFSNAVTGSSYEFKVTITRRRVTYDSAHGVYTTSIIDTKDYTWEFKKGVTASEQQALQGCTQTALTASTLNVAYDGSTDKFTITRSGSLFNSIRTNSKTTTTYYAEIDCSISGHISTLIPSVSTRGILDIGYSMRFDDPRNIFVVDNDWTWSPNMTHDSGDESNTTFEVTKDVPEGLPGYWPLFIVDFNRRNGTGGSGVSNWCCGAMFLSERQVNRAVVYIKGNAAGGHVTKVNAGVKILWLRLTHNDIYSASSDIGPDD